MSSLFFELVMKREEDICLPGELCGICPSIFVQDVLIPIIKANGGVPSAVRSMPIMEVLQNRAWIKYLAQELLCLPISEYVKLPHWKGHLNEAFHFCDSDLKATVLHRWLNFYSGNVLFVDWLVFYAIRRFRRHTLIWDRWIKAALELAERTKDESLVESLVLTLRPNISAYPSFASLARELAGQSRVIAKVLNAAST